MANREEYLDNAVSSSYGCRGVWLSGAEPGARGQAVTPRTGKDPIHSLARRVLKSCRSAGGTCAHDCSAARGDGDEDRGSNGLTGGRCRPGESSDPCQSRCLAWI